MYFNMTGTIISVDNEVVLPYEYTKLSNKIFQKEWYKLYSS